MKNIAIFASGTGSNFIAIHNAILNKELNCNLEVVVSDRPSSKAIETAKKRKIHTFTFNPKSFSSKEEFEESILKYLTIHNIDLIVLAGYMRLIGPTLLKAYDKRILNIHPSLLPLYKGKDALGQALADNAKKTGVTVHYVDSGMDTGSIIEQVSIEIYQNEERESLEKRIHEVEHQLYKKVIKKVIEEI